jgi:hypothetical protein
LQKRGSSSFFNIFTMLVTCNCSGSSMSDYFVRSPRGKGSAVRSPRTPGSAVSARTRKCGRRGSRH